DWRLRVLVTRLCLSPCRCWGLRPPQRSILSFRWEGSRLSHTNPTSGRPVRFIDFGALNWNAVVDMSAKIPAKNLEPMDRFTFRFCKRILDLLVSVLVLILLTPLLALIAM